LRQRDAARVLDGVLGDFEVAHLAGDGRYRRPPMGAEHVLE
jgi:hypothetical protein